MFDNIPKRGRSIFYYRDDSKILEATVLSYQNYPSRPYYCVLYADVEFRIDHKRILGFTKPTLYERFVYMWFRLSNIL